MNADTNAYVMYDLLRTWVDDVHVNLNDVSKQTQAWCLFLKCLLEGLNSVTLDISDLMDL